MNLKNAHDLLDGCFSREDRLRIAIQQAIKDNKTVAFLLKDDELSVLIDHWYKLFCAVGNMPQHHEGDRFVLQFLQEYMWRNRLAMYVPDFAKVSQTTSGLPIYEIKKYVRHRIFTPSFGKQFHEGNVKLFLKYFASGAHFVALHSSEDLGGQGLESLYALVAPGTTGGKGKLNDRTRIAPMHSHYGAVGNLLGGMTGSLYKDRGVYYPKTPIGETAPQEKCPTIVSLLFGPTSHGELDVAFVGGTYGGSQWAAPTPTISQKRINTFFQLEGWPATNSLGSGTLEVITNRLSSLVTRGSAPTELGRHNIDYKVHANTVWNLSTFGASAYTEKRATTIFLAPLDWNPKPSQETKMMSYVGLDTKWMAQELIRVANSPPDCANA